MTFVFSKVEVILTIAKCDFIYNRNYLGEEGKEEKEKTNKYNERQLERETRVTAIFSN